MRLFIAIHFDEKTIAEIGKIRDELRSKASAGRFTRDDNLHLTLVFLGEVDEGLIPAIRHAMNRVSVELFILQFSSIGFFNRADGQIWWVGIEPNAMLIEVQSFLSRQLAEAGFTMEKRKYTPHLTLGRNIRLKTQPEKTISPFEYRVGSISLMKSENINGKTIYTAIYEKPLKKLEEKNV